MKVAIVYDRINKLGGAERILIALHELFPDAPFYTSVYDRDGAVWAKGLDIRTSFLQKIPFAKNRHDLFGALMPIAFEQFNFDEYELVISVTSEAAKGIITKPKTFHLCYCLTPTRYLWSGYDEYFKSPFLRVLSYPIVKYLKIWEKTAASRPDIFLSISNEVKKRVKLFYNKQSDVIYPPTGVSHSKDKKKYAGDYFLVVSRLVPYKRVDLAIKACNNLGIKLKIVGSGSSLGDLKKISGNTIEFLGSLTDDELVKYYKGCLGLIFPGKEDFGLTILEAQLYGKPVIAYRAGGAIETIIDKKTGLFFYPQTIKALENALMRFKKIKFDKRECIYHATLFSKKSFQKEFMDYLNKIMEDKL